MNPISRSVLRRLSVHCETFQSDYPLPNFNVIPNFLASELVRGVLPACQTARYRTFCGYSHPNSTVVKSHFCDPNEEDTYITVHERPIHIIKALNRLHALFKKQETVDALSALTGLTLTNVGLHVLTSWQPGSFLELHTDYDSRGAARLILSLSLTRRWRSEYGGTAVYAWKGLNRSVRITPHCNTAVLFVPFSGSNHWVEQVSPHAPHRQRFTWTIFFR